MNIGKMISFTACICAISTWLYAGTANDKTAERIDIPRRAIASSMRPLSLDEIVSLREVHEPRLSPDGRRVAYVVKQAFRACNCNRAALFVASAERYGEGKKLLEEESISGVNWSPDGKYVSYLSPKSGSVQLWRMDPDTGISAQIFNHAATSQFTRSLKVEATAPIGILGYEWSHDGSMVVFTAISGVDAAKNEELAKKGFVYDDARMMLPELSQLRDWNIADRRAQLWLYRVTDGVEEKIWEGSPAGVWAGISAFSWSNDDSYVAFAYDAQKANLSNGGSWPAQNDNDIVVLNVRPGKEEARSARFHGSVFKLAWSFSGTQLAILSAPDISGATLSLIDVRSGRQSTVLEDIHASHDLLVWDADARHLYLHSREPAQHQGNLGIVEVDVENKTARRLSPSGFRASECSRPVQRKLSCVWQSPTLAPNPAIVDLDSGRAFVLADTNPELNGIEPVNVREMYWRNEFGDETNGYLVLPANAESKSPRPLVIIGYGFSGEFVAQAAYLTTYPAREFARRGYAVLLANPQEFKGWTNPSFAKGSMAFGYGPLSSLRVVIKQLAKDGVIDETRIGFMGHSWAGFWVEFAITQSQLFRAVEIHEGGTNVEPGTYWKTGFKGVRDVQEHLMGGPPYGENLKNYEKFSPALNARNVRSPVLMEFNPTSVFSGVEVFTALRSAGAPVELVIYPDDGHVYAQPEHRYYSMQRNLDWFEFWLRDKEDPDPAKAEQFARWRKLREQRDSMPHPQPSVN